MSQHGVHGHDHHYCETCKVPHLFEVAGAGQSHVGFCMKTCEAFGKKKGQQTGTPAAPHVRACMDRCSDLSWAPPSASPARPGRRGRERKLTRRRKGPLARMFRKRRRRFGVGKTSAGWRASARTQSGVWIVRVVAGSTSVPLVKGAYVETSVPMQSAKSPHVTAFRRLPPLYDVEAPKGFGRPTKVVLHFIDGTSRSIPVSAPKVGRGPHRARRKRKRGFLAQLFGRRSRRGRRFSVGHQCGTWVSDHGAHGREVMTVGHDSPQHWHQGKRQVTKPGYAPDMSIGCSARCGGRF